MRHLLLAAVLIAGLVSPALADLSELTATITGDQANAGVGTGSPGTGAATMSYDSDTGTLTWELSWSGMLGNETACHFHGAAAPGVNAGVQVNIFAISGFVSPSNGSTVITAQQASDLLNGLWYINIHTDMFPGGEIRGQVTLVETVPATDANISRMKASFR